MRAIKNIRLRPYDYSSNGYYFVTVCTDYLKPYLVGHPKSVVAQFIEQTFNSKYISGVDLDWHIIMPTHIHLILILQNCNLRLGEVIRRFKAKTSKMIGFKIWQPNYYEHVIRDTRALNRIREYIQNNPQVREIDFEEFYNHLPDKSGNYKTRCSCPRTRCSCPIHWAKALA